MFPLSAISGLLSLHSLAVIPNNATFKTSASSAYTNFFCFSVKVGTIILLMAQYEPNN